MGEANHKQGDQQEESQKSTRTLWKVQIGGPSPEYQIPIDVSCADDALQDDSEELSQAGDCVGKVDKSSGECVNQTAKQRSTPSQKSDVQPTPIPTTKPQLKDTATGNRNLYFNLPASSTSIDQSQQSSTPAPVYIKPKYMSAMPVFKIDSDPLTAMPSSPHDAVFTSPDPLASPSDIAARIGPATYPNSYLSSTRPQAHYQHSQNGY